jgi:hypothetical protein
MINAVPGVEEERRQRLIKVLDIDPNWRMHQLSDGQRRRVQICVGLLRPFKVGSSWLGGQGGAGQGMALPTEREMAERADGMMGEAGWETWREASGSQHAMPMTPPPPACACSAYSCPQPPPPLRLLSPPPRSPRCCCWTRSL